MRKVVAKHCRPEAFALLAAQLEQIETREALVNGAVAIAMHDAPHASPDTCQAELDRLADAIAARVKGGSSSATLAHAHQVLFEEEGFAGNFQNYYDPRNSYLPDVLQSKRGLPILLVLVYKAVLERLGLTVYGINAPAHFLACVEKGEGDQPVLIDPFFGGRVLSRREALDQIQSMTGAVEAEETLAVATHRQWLVRMTYNLEGTFGRADRYNEVAAMLEMRALLGGEA